MIKIIKPTPIEWKTSCLHCRCGFVYEYTDLVLMYASERPAWIACPSCGQMCCHVLARPIAEPEIAVVPDGYQPGIS